MSETLSKFCSVAVPILLRGQQRAVVPRMSSQYIRNTTNKTPIGQDMQHFLPKKNYSSDQKSPPSIPSDANGNRTRPLDAADPKMELERTVNSCDNPVGPFPFETVAEYVERKTRLAAYAIVDTGLEEKLREAEAITEKDSTTNETPIGQDMQSFPLNTNYSNDEKTSFNIPSNANEIGTGRSDATDPKMELEQTANSWYNVFGPSPSESVSQYMERIGPAAAYAVWTYGLTEKLPEAITEKDSTTNKTPTGQDMQSLPLKNYSSDQKTSSNIPSNANGIGTGRSDAADPKIELDETLIAWYNSEAPLIFESDSQYLERRSRLAAYAIVDTGLEEKLREAEAIAEKDNFTSISDLETWRRCMLGIQEELDLHDLQRYNSLVAAVRNRQRMLLNTIYPSHGRANTDLDRIWLVYEDFIKQLEECFPYMPTKYILKQICYIAERRLRTFHENTILKLSSEIEENAVNSEKNDVNGLHVAILRHLSTQIRNFMHSDEFKEEPDTKKVFSKYRDELTKCYGLLRDNRLNELRDYISQSDRDPQVDA